MSAWQPKWRFRPLIQIDYNYIAPPLEEKIIYWKDLPAIMSRPIGLQTQTQAVTVAQGRQICKIIADPVSDYMIN